MGCFFEDGFELRIARQDVGALARDRSGREYFVIDDEAFYIDGKDELELRTFPKPMWPGGVVYYQFAPGLSAVKKSAFKKAGKLWSDIAKVSFSENAHAGGYVLVETSSTENVSAVGYTQVTGQLFKITTWTNLYIIAHEIAHTLGMTHEHRRSDRDDFVEIHTANIQPGKEKNFNPPVSSTNYSTYDYESVMHYSYNAFGIVVLGTAAQTISVRPPNVFDQNLLGQRTKLSANDKFDMASRYGSP